MEEVPEIQSKMKQEILKQCTVEGNVVKLPNIQLERKLYQEVAKALELIGGKWKGGKVMGFVFLTDPTELLEQIAGGEKRNLKKEFQFFGTPAALADEMVDLAGLKYTDTILEPSAGQGAIIRAINKVTDVVPDCFELMPENRIILNRSGLSFRMLGEDFLKEKKTTYDKIIANPPFTKNQDIDHIQEMYEILNTGGRIVCIMSESWVTGSQIKQVAFRGWLESVRSSNIILPKGTFKESGTQVGARLIIIDKD